MNTAKTDIHFLGSEDKNPAESEWATYTGIWQVWLLGRLIFAFDGAEADITRRIDITKKGFSDASTSVKRQRYQRENKSAFVWNTSTEFADVYNSETWTIDYLR